MTKTDVAVVVLATAIGGGLLWGSGVLEEVFESASATDPGKAHQMANWRTGRVNEQPKALCDYAPDGC